MQQLRLLRRQRFKRRRQPPTPTTYTTTPPTTPPGPASPPRLQRQPPTHCPSPNRSLWAEPCPTPSPSMLTSPSNSQQYPRRDLTSSHSNRSLWAEPCPTPSKSMLASPILNQQHHRCAQTPNYSSPIQFPHSLSPIPRPNLPPIPPTQLNLTLTLSPPIPQPYTNNQLNVLNEIYLTYPHLNRTCLPVPTICPPLLSTSSSLDLI